MTRLRTRFLEAVEAEKAMYMADSVPVGPWIRSPADYMQYQNTRLPFRCKTSRREPTSWTADDAEGTVSTWWSGGQG